jgi:hypothetical protein
MTGTLFARVQPGLFRLPYSYTLRIESFVLVGAVCSRDGGYDRGYKPLPEVCHLPESPGG